MRHLYGRAVLAASLAALALAGGAAADEGHVLRLVGEAPAATDPAPRRFVIDAVVTPGDAPFKSEVSGWVAALPPDSGAGELSGSCVEDACALSADFDGGRLALTGPLISAKGPGAGKARFGDDGPTVEARFSPLSGPIPDLGALADPAATTAAELRDLLLWNDAPTGFSNAEPSGPPDSFEREALQTWQGASGRPMTGLILSADLEALREAARAAKARAGWTPLGDEAHGWSAGYPAALMKEAGGAAGEHRFVSSDGKAVLVIAIEPPRDAEAFDALVDRETAERPGRTDVSYTRVNSEMELSFTEKGVRTVEAFHTRRDGFARMVFTYPAGDEAWAKYETIFARSLKAGEALTAQ